MDIVTRHLDKVDQFSLQAQLEHGKAAESASATGAVVSVVTGSFGAVVGVAAGVSAGVLDSVDGAPQVVRNQQGYVTDVHQSNLAINVKMTTVLGLMGVAATGFTAATGHAVPLEHAALFTGATMALWPAVTAFTLGLVGAAKGAVAGFRKGGAIGYEAQKAIANGLTGKKALPQPAAAPKLEAPGEHIPMTLATKEPVRVLGGTDS